MFTFPLTLMSGDFSGGGGSGLIESIQHITITIGTSSSSNTATISSVNTANTMLVYGGLTSDDADEAGENSRPVLKLTNSTTITVEREAADVGSTLTVKCVVVEWKSDTIESIQYGTIALTAVLSNTATITSVTTANSACLFLGAKVNATAGASQRTMICSVALTNSTTVTGTRGNATGNVTDLSFCIVEFKSGILNSSVQQVSINNAGTSQTATITSVVTAQTALLYGGSTSIRADVPSTRSTIELTNSTTLTTKRVSSSGNININCSVVEFKAADIVDVDRSITNMGGGLSSKTVTIGAVVLAKSFISFLGFDADAANNDNADENEISVELTNTTTITIAKDSTNGSEINISTEVVEFT